MTEAISHRHALVSRGEAGLACDAEGVALGPICLVSRREGHDVWAAASLRDVELALRLAYGHDDKNLARRCHAGLDRIAKALAASDVVRAAVEAVHLGLPPLDRKAMKKLAALSPLSKGVDAWQNEPRLPAGQAGGGQWTTAGGDPPAPQSAATRESPLQQQKATFARRYLATARLYAAMLKVPVENLLGVAALESRWGKSRFVAAGNNLFGMYYPAPFATGSVPAKGNANARLARFSSVDDSFKSFVAKYASGLTGVSDPGQFAAILQDRYKFGRDTTTGRKVPGYVKNVASTIEGLRPYVR